MIPVLGPAHAFPPVSRALAEPDGLLAAGGDLSAGRLLAAYRSAVFPWFSPGDPILWWSPSQRMVLEPARVRVTRSLAKVLRNRAYHITINQAFDTVMRACAAPRGGQAGTWITDEMVAAYGELHRQGYAHSYECWQDGQLAGGLYGVAVGRMFYGESMFHRATDASKMTFVSMARHLHRHGFAMVDCQMFTPHLESLGAQLITRGEFIARLEKAIHLPQPPGMWEDEFRHEPPR